MRATELDRPSWEAVDAAIRALDNASRNDLYLTPHRADPDTYLSIGGGAGRYIVTGSIKSEQFPTVIDPTKAAEPSEHVVVGGQSGQYAGNRVLDLDTALRAAQAFHATGLFQGQVTWIMA
jgi:G:T/U-mismatch repair DNA glycosylase